MTRFNISFIIGHYLGKHAYGLENNFHRTWYGCLYLVHSPSANKQKGAEYGV